MHTILTSPNCTNPFTQWKDWNFILFWNWVSNNWLGCPNQFGNFSHFFLTFSVHYLKITDNHSIHCCKELVLSLYMLIGASVIMEIYECPKLNAHFWTWIVILSTTGHINLSFMIQSLSYWLHRYDPPRQNQPYCAQNRSQERPSLQTTTFELQMWGL